MADKMLVQVRVIKTCDEFGIDKESICWKVMYKCPTCQNLLTTEVTNCPYCHTKFAGVMFPIDV